MQIPTSSLSRAAAALSNLIAEQQLRADTLRREQRPYIELLAEIRRNQAARADLLAVLASQRADEREQQRASCYGS